MASPIIQVTVRNGETINLSWDDVTALRTIVEAQVMGSTLTSLSLDKHDRRKMRDLAKRGIVSIGKADEGDARHKAYSIDDWRVREAVMD